MAEAYGKRVKDLTVEQLEAEVHKALAEATPADALKNMPIGGVSWTTSVAGTGIPGDKRDAVENCRSLDVRRWQRPRREPAQGEGARL